MKSRILLTIFLCAVGCAKPAPPPNPYGIDCATAAAQVQTLQIELSTVLSGTQRSVIPDQAAAAILGPEYATGAAVGTGKYKDDLERRIYLLKSTCGISDA